MPLPTLNELLKGNTYPGRGLILGLHADGVHAVMAYFIMGRSENSRNRVFVADGDGLRTQAFDPSKLTDPSLIIYAPVRVRDETTVVTNGDQTDTICDFLGQGKTFEEALRTRIYEPDAPNYTPRVSGILTREGDSFSFKLAICKSDDGDPAQCVRQFFEYEQPLPGVGRFLHTYRCDGNPIPSFAGEPEAVALAGGIDDFTRETWAALDADNRVSLFVRYIHLLNGGRDDRIVNRNH